MLPSGPTQFKADVQDRGGGIDVCKVFRNRELVHTFERPTVVNGYANLETNIELLPGETELRMICFDRAGVPGRIAHTNVFVEGTPAPATAYLIAVGIDKYDDESRRLTYAVADGQLFLEATSKALNSTGRYKSVVRIPLFDADATVPNIRAVFAALLKTGDERVAATGRRKFPALATAQPGDAVFLYFAGHGGMRGKDYALLMRDFREGSPGTVLTDQDLRRLFVDLDARDLAIVIDACESGGILGAPDERVGPFNSSSFAQMSYDKGVYVLVASQSVQSALELQELGHGLLTHTLLKEGLEKTAADRDPKDGNITLREFLQYPINEVPLWQERKRLNLVATGGAVTEPGNPRKMSLKGETGSWTQTPRAFIPPFGYNDAFVVQQVSK